MKNYKVVSQFYDTGKTHAYIIEEGDILFNQVEDCSTKQYDQYVDEFNSIKEAKKAVIDVHNS